ncbi:MAG: hypothetical protein JW892_16110 [Anaerolineae bacterium]|nr:hypothetical protein [Anaerolineae bacterium]
MKDITEKFGSNFLVAAFVPSLAFVAMAMVFFGPIIPSELIDRMKNTFEPFGQSGVLFLALSIILGFVLSSLNTFLYKLLEGYFFLVRLPGSRKRQEKKRNSLKLQLQTVDQEITDLFNSSDPDKERLQNLADKQYYLVAEITSRFPDTVEGVLPTTFGNLFRAAETYANRRYGIDAVQLWPRLVHVIPESYYHKVEQSNNGLAFLVNCAALTLFFSILSACAALYQYAVWQIALRGGGDILYFIHVDSRVAHHYQQHMWIYSGAFVISLALSRLFYVSSFPIVREYGDMIRSCFDLFRFDLLKQLRLPLPENSKREYELWRAISEFTTIGDYRGPLKFEYELARDKPGGTDEAKKAADSNFWQRVFRR